VEAAGWDDCGFWGDEENDNDDQPFVPGNSTRLDRPPNAPAREHPDDRKKRNMQKRKVQRRDPENPYDEEMTWDGEDHPHDDKSPPTTILPNGARHEFDPKQNYVSWSM
jgi:hypothetical protein